MNCTNSTKGPIELSEFSLYCMDIFHDQLDDVYRFMGIPSDKEFPGCFYSDKVSGANKNFINSMKKVAMELIMW